jgi:hypothetical protein
MLIEAETDDGIQIRLDRQEAVQRGPQAVAANRQDQRFDLAVLLDHVDRGELLAPLDQAMSSAPARAADCFGSFDCLQRIESHRIELVPVLPGLQIDDAP